MQTLPETYAFVDVETTGGMARYSRLLEIAIWRVENGEIVDSLNTLVDPQTVIPSEITQLTGITAADVSQAPTFRQIADRVVELLDGAVFVAHNARFDYSFVRMEMKRVGITLSRPTLCTVKLFRALVPQLGHHNLDSLINYYDLNCNSRHRAAADARVLVDFFTFGPRFHGPGFMEVVKKQLQRPSWPSGLSHLSQTSLPETPGVYIFKDQEGLPIYIGKAINVRERVVSHFMNDLETKELKLAAQVRDIEVIPTAGEMGALLLESQLIKERLPIYNRMLRKSAGMVGIYVAQRPDGYNTLELRNTQRVDPQDPALICLVKSKARAVEIIRQLAETHRLCPRILGLENGQGTCFWRQLDKCDGACEGACPAWKFNATLAGALTDRKVQTWPFTGVVTYSEEAEGLVSTWVIDNWCLLEHHQKDAEGNYVSRKYEGKFDWDTYKILRKFLVQDAHSSGVRKLADDWATNS